MRNDYCLLAVEQEEFAVGFELPQVVFFPQIQVL
jgi:hypothetical protein